MSFIESKLHYNAITIIMNYVVHNSHKYADKIVRQGYIQITTNNEFLDDYLQLKNSYFDSDLKLLSCKSLNEMTSFIIFNTKLSLNYKIILITKTGEIAEITNQCKRLETRYFSWEIDKNIEDKIQSYIEHRNLFLGKLIYVGNNIFYCRFYKKTENDCIFLVESVISKYCIIYDITVKVQQFSDIMQKIEEISSFMNDLEFSTFLYEGDEIIMMNENLISRPNKFSTIQYQYRIIIKSKQLLAVFDSTEYAYRIILEYLEDGTINEKFKPITNRVKSANK